MIVLVLVLLTVSLFVDDGCQRTGPDDAVVSIFICAVVNS